MRIDVKGLGVGWCGCVGWGGVGGCMRVSPDV